MKQEEKPVPSNGRSHDRGHFQAALRREIIKSIEEGVPRSVISYQYGIARSTLSDWMRRDGSPEYQAKRRGKHLTEIEKRSVVRSIEQGILTFDAARKTYGLSGVTLKKWLKESLKENVELAIEDPLETEKEPAAQPDLPESETEALTRALAEAQWKIRALNTLIDVAEDEFKIAIRKKAGAKQSS